MPAYKDEKKGTWRVTFRYTDWTGKKKQTTKRGFRTKREALQYEAKFLARTKVDMDILLEDFMEIYFRDKEYELKPSSIKNKRHTMVTHVLPYFGKRKMSEITPSEVIQWQNEIQKKNFKRTYEREIQKQLSCLFNHAVRVYDHTNNPCTKVKKMGKADAEKFDFWTKNEYEHFIQQVDKDSDDYIIFEILFWTGCREGELLALTPRDFDFRNNLLYITKTYNRINGEDIISTPKTETSVRTIIIPDFLNKEIKEFVDAHYGIPDTERLFPIVPRTLQKRMEKLIEKAEVKKIRVHDLRHSHVCLSKGYFKNSVRNAYFTGVSAIAYAPFSVVFSEVVSKVEAFSFEIRSFSALRRL